MHINMDWGRLLLSVDGRGCEEVLVCMIRYGMVWCGMVCYGIARYGMVCTIYMVWFLSVSQELTNLKLSPITRRSSFCKSLSISNYTEKHIAKDSESKPIINETLWAEVDCQYFGLWLNQSENRKPFLSFSWILERERCWTFSRPGDIF